AVHARRDLHLDLPLFPQPPFPITGGTGFREKFLHPLTAGTGGGDLKDTVAAGNHPPAGALGTRDAPGPRFGPGTTAGAAVHYPGNLHRHFAAQGGVEKIKGQIVAQVGAGLGTRTATHAAHTAHAAEAPHAEHVLEDVAEGPEDVAEIPEAGEAGGRDPFMAIEIVETALFRVVQDLVSLSRLFEPLFRVMVPGIAIRVVLKGYLPVGLLDIVDGGVARHSQNGVVILFGRHITFISVALERIFFCRPGRLLYRGGRRWRCGSSPV